MWRIPEDFERACRAMKFEIDADFTTPKASGVTLTRIACLYGFYRKWYEWNPLVGDWFLRRRIASYLEFTPL